MCGSDRAQDKERRRAGEREPRRKIWCLLGTGVAPNRLSSEQASNGNKKGGGGKKRDDEKIAVLVLT